jgi:hypothetical protein
MKWIAFTIGVALMACVLVGCSTESRTDWNDRIGKYTYDQSVRDLGKPDKNAKENDGSVVAEWLRRSNSPATVGTGGGSEYLADPGWMQSQIVAVYPEGPDEGQWLRLTFGPDGKLASWKRYREK